MNLPKVRAYSFSLIAALSVLTANTATAQDSRTVEYSCALYSTEGQAVALGSGSRKLVACSELPDGSIFYSLQGQLGFCSADLITLGRTPLGLPLKGRVVLKQLPASETIEAHSLSMALGKASVFDSSGDVHLVHVSGIEIRLGREIFMLEAQLQNNRGSSLQCQVTIS